MGNYYVNYQNYQNQMLLTSLDTKRALMHLILVYKYRPERTGPNMQRIRNRNQLSLPYYLGVS